MGVFYVLFTILCIIRFISPIDETMDLIYQMGDAFHGVLIFICVACKQKIAELLRKN